MQWWVEQLQVITADTQQLLLVCWENTAITRMSNLTKKMMRAFLVLMSHQSGDQIRTRQVGDVTRLSLGNVTETCGQRRPYESPNSGVKLARRWFCTQLWGSESGRQRANTGCSSKNGFIRPKYRNKLQNKHNLMETQAHKKRSV